MDKIGTKTIVCSKKQKRKLLPISGTRKSVKIGRSSEPSHLGLLNPPIRPYANGEFSLFWYILHESVLLLLVNSEKTVIFDRYQTCTHFPNGASHITENCNHLCPRTRIEILGNLSRCRSEMLSFLVATVFIYSRK